MKIVVIGAGELGYHLSERLTSENHDVTIIEQNESRGNYVLEHLDVQVVTGSGSSPSALDLANIGEADILVAATDYDEINMVACMIASTQTRSPRKIARIRSNELLTHASIMGQNFLDIGYAVNPDNAVIDEIENILKIPGCTEVAQFSNGKTLIAGFRLTESSPMVNSTLADFFRSSESDHIVIAAVKRAKKIIVPNGSTYLEAGDIVYVAHPSETLSKVYPVMGVKESTTKMVIIAHATRLGVELAQRLQKNSRNINLKIIEPNLELCHQVADELPNALVLNADPHEKEILEQANIADADVFISTGDEDDSNVLISLLASNMGAKRTITLINNSNYIPLIEAIGNQVALCPKMVAVSQILQYIRKGNVLSLAAFGNHEAEAIEILASEDDPLTKKILADLDIPKGITVASICRNGQHITPKGETLIEPGDRVTIFVNQHSSAKLDNLIAEKTRF